MCAYIQKHIYYISQKFIFQDSTDPITYESIMGDIEDVGENGERG